MNFRVILLGYIIPLAFASCKNEKQQKIKPNIILTMSNDMGYSDIGCHSDLIDIPVLDGLTENGLRFTEFV